MSLMNIKNMKNEKGFTIVELLIVIVVIGILAAITIVAYNGVQNRSRQASAQAAANSVVKKAEMYNAEPATVGYPVLGANLTGAASTTTYALTGVTFTSAATAMTAAPGSPSTLDFWTCGATTGIKVGYWDYVAGNVAYVYAGGANSGTTCTKTTS